MNNYQQTLTTGHSNGDITRFEVRMIQIRKCCGEIILQDGGGFTEIDPMFLEIARSLVRIPLENHTGKYILDRLSNATLHR